MGISLLISMLLVTGSLFARNLDTVFQLLPQPQSVEVYSGKGIGYGELTYVTSAGETPAPVLGAITDGLPRCKRSGKSVCFQLSQTNVPDSPEGYVLEITAKGATVTSRGETGLFYGAQTLEQLLEDKLRFTRRPEVAAPNAISKQEMQALCRYAKERNVEISPLVQGLGHAGFILKHHWELRENPASDWEFCPSAPRTYEVQFDLYLDALEAMPYGRYLHVGGDEITAIGIDERCKATGKSAFELQMIWLKRVCRFAVEHGRIPIFWDDMPLKYAGVWDLIQSGKTEEEVAKEWNSDKLDKAIDLFPKECVYMRWNYGDATKPAHRRMLKWYSDKGLKVMGATAFTLIDLPDKENPGAWSEKYKEKIDRAKEEAERYKTIAGGIRVAEQNALRNRYTLEIYEQTNNLQNYPVRLILALNEFDTAKDATARKVAQGKILEVCDSFKVMRDNLESVYSETRFMQQPEGFIADMNHHNHLASKTDNSDWLYLYEIPMIKKVRVWLE